MLYLRNNNKWFFLSFFLLILMSFQLSDWNFLTYINHFFHYFLSYTKFLISPIVFPIFLPASPTCSIQVVLGLPLFHFTRFSISNASFLILSGYILTTCPYHLSCLLSIFEGIRIFFYFLFLSLSSFVISTTLRRSSISIVLSLLTCFFCNIQFSLDYNIVSVVELHLRLHIYFKWY